MIRTFTTHLLATVSLLGCANTPLYPNALKPNVPHPEIYESLTPAVPALDCVSAQASSLEPLVARKFAKTRETRNISPDYDSGKIRLALGELSNKVGPSIGTLTLPTSLRSNVRNSLARFDTFWRLYDNESLIGSSTETVPLIPHGTLAKDYYFGSIIKPEIVIEGGIFAGEVRRNADMDADIAYFGFGSKTKAIELEIQFWMTWAATRITLTRPLSLRARVYEAENGASAFVILTDEYVRIKAGMLEQPAGGYAIQLLTDLAIAQLTREFSTTQFGADFATCDKYFPIPNLGRRSVTDYVPDERPVRLVIEPRKTLGVCAKVEGPFNHQPAGKKIIGRWRQFRDTHIELTSLEVKQELPPQVNTDGAGKAICLPWDNISNITKAMEVSFEEITPNKTSFKRKLIAVGRINLEQ